MPGLRKRSVLLSGHATSIALEPEFWAVLEDLARGRGVSLAAVIVSIDRGRGPRPLASACRVAALMHAQAGEGQRALGAMPPGVPGADSVAGAGGM